MIIDVKGLLMGRVATVIAKKALEEEELIVINCNDVVTSGNFKDVVAHFKKKFELGGSGWGPYYIRDPARMFKRTIRGMLPWKRTRGREAFRRIKCYNTTPVEFKGTPVTFKEFHISNHSNPKHTSLGEVCKQLGGKQ